MTTTQLRARLSHNPHYVTDRILDDEVFEISWRPGRAIPALPTTVETRVGFLPVRVAIWREGHPFGGAGAPTPPSNLPLLVSLGAGGLILLTGIGVLVASSAGK